jgi:hypothetical protein
MPEACRAETEAEAAAPTKREATAKAFKGMRRDSPAQPLLTDDTPQPNWATLARAHHQWLKVLPLFFSSSILRDRTPPLSVASVELSRPALLAFSNRSDYIVLSSYGLRFCSFTCIGLPLFLGFDGLQKCFIGFKLHYYYYFKKKFRGVLVVWTFTKLVLWLSH